MTTDYVFVGVSAHDKATFVDIGPARTEQEPMTHARRLLNEHRSFERVEIWRDDDCVAVVTRALRAEAS